LVVGEIGLACLLLIGSELMLRSFVNLLRTDPGFRPEHVITAGVTLPDATYKQLEDLINSSTACAPICGNFRAYARPASGPPPLDRV
jgi:hypothetical protein